MKNLRIFLAIISCFLFSFANTYAGNGGSEILKTVIISPCGYNLFMVNYYEIENKENELLAKEELKATVCLLGENDIVTELRSLIGNQEHEFNNLNDNEYEYIKNFMKKYNCYDYGLIHIFNCCGSDKNLDLENFVLKIKSIIH